MLTQPPTTDEVAKEKKYLRGIVNVVIICRSKMCIKLHISSDFISLGTIRQLSLVLIGPEKNAF